MTDNTKYYELYRRSSLGGALTDTLDQLITERRIEPQLAMKILLNFDKAVADVLSDKVKSRLTFKVRRADISIPTASATTSGPSLSRTSTSSWIIPTKCMPTASRLSAAMQSVQARPRAKPVVLLAFASILKTYFRGEIRDTRSRLTAG
ncbi:hypothetical protein IAQ61_003679 [Plenodomus lingam]|uniref:uncharacterized protein n=1 Tax=Leptosphaeria maculans TaxID=5022 RepID=UPI00332D48D4|nr:hypothetical protein IAQ61_003679 [Plenodomus lingam]